MLPASCWLCSHEWPLLGVFFFHFFGKSPVAALDSACVQLWKVPADDSSLTLDWLWRPGEEGLWFWALGWASVAAQGGRLPHSTPVEGLWTPGWGWLGKQNCNPRQQEGCHGPPSKPQAAGSFQWGALVMDHCKLDLHLIHFDLWCMLKTEGRRPVQFRDVCISKSVVMAIFLYCQEEHPRFKVTFQLFKLGK